MSLESAELHELIFSFYTDVKTELSLPWTVFTDLRLLGLICVFS